MATGADSQILKKTEKLRIRGRGRPKVNRELAKRLIIAKYSTADIVNTLKCDKKTVYRIRDELIASGEVKPEEMKDIEKPIVSADFDQECERATGFKFSIWLGNRAKHAPSIFNFCYQVWDQVWEKPSLFAAKDVNDQLGDQLCVKFLSKFGEDTQRIRDRKKKIRNLFRFLGRHDLCDRHLTMTNSRDPRRIRRLPAIEMLDFPLKFEEALNSLPEDMRTAIRFKLVAQMRTGKRLDERGFFGIRKGTEGRSYLLMSGSEAQDFRCHVLEKMSEEWDITHLPEAVRVGLFKIYEETKDGAFIFNRFEETLIKAWKAATKKHIGTAFTLHDLRKVGVTWYYACRIPLEIATSLNVGWKDLNTPRDHYLHLRQLLKKSQRAIYVGNIPAWFKNGLEEYREEE